MLRRTRTRLRPQPKPSMHVHTSATAFALWWLGLLVLHGANLAYYAGVAKLYKSFDVSYLVFQLRTFSIGVPPEDYATVSRIHACVAALHALLMLMMIGSSLYARKLVFQPDAKAMARGLVRLPIVGPLFTRCAMILPWRSSTTDEKSDSNRPSSAIVMSFVADCVAKGGSVFARDGLLGVDSVYFDHVLLVRELVETTLQTIQLYRMTLVLPRLWLIRSYVALLVLNCWAVPFLHRMYRDRETTRRMLCLLCDAVLDMLSSIGVSIVIFATYAPQYNDPNGWGFPILTWFDDTWFSNMQQEFQMMLVSSWGDMVSRLVFALGLLQCMEAIKEMLTPVATPRRPTKGFMPSIAVAMAPAPTSLVAPGEALERTDDINGKAEQLRRESRLPESVVSAVEPPNRVSNGVAEATPARPTKGSMASRIVAFLLHVVGPGLFVLWGCAILAVHCMAESNHSHTACDLRLQPWLSRKPGCSLVEFNCAALASSGDDDAFNAVWDAFDPDRATRVVIRHCARLVVSPKLRSYHKITGLKIYNSSVVDWNDAASVTTADHASLRVVFLLRSVFPNGELPLGLLSPDFPPRMTNMFTATTNFQSLPSDLDTKWPQGMQTTFESSYFTNIPDVIVRLAPRTLSMAGSPIDTIPAALIESPNLTVLQIGLTRIQELPATVKHIHPRFELLMVQFTHITILPPYLNGFAEYTIDLPIRLFNAFGTPYCRELDEIVAGTRQAFTNATAPNALLMDVSTPEKRAFAERAVDCSGPGLLFYYPLPVEDMNHGLQ